MSGAGDAGARYEFVVPPDSAARLDLAIVAATGLVWFAGALLLHGPEIRSQGLQWRFGLTSVGELLLIVIASALAIWYGVIAAQEKAGA